MIMKRIIIELFNKAKPQQNYMSNFHFCLQKIFNQKKKTPKKSHEVVVINSQIDLTYLTCSKCMVKVNQHFQINVCWRL